MAQTMAARLAPDCLERLKRALETKKITARSPSAAVSDRPSIQSSGHGF